MDIFLIIEAVEIVGICVYLLYSRPQHQDVKTQGALLVHALLIGIDVFILRRHRPELIRDGMNAYAVLAWGYVYAKVYHKYFVAFLAMLGR